VAVRPVEDMPQDMCSYLSFITKICFKWLPYARQSILPKCQ